MSESAEPSSDLVAPETLKGFQDLLPRDMIPRNNVVRKIQAVYEKYGFLPIDTPVLEYLSTLIGTGGEETNKSLFRLNSPEDDPIAMRFDLTVPFARLIAQYPDKLTLPFRRYHIGPVFRVDKPGPGRYRQFTQFDIDAAGSTSIAVDGEILAAMTDAMKAVGFSNADGGDQKRRFEIRVNNRKLVDAALLDADISSRQTAGHVLRVIDKLLKVGIDNVRKELAEGRIDESGDRIRGVGLTTPVIDKILAFTDTRGTSRRELIDQLRKKLSDSEASRAALLQMEQLAEALDSLGVGERDAVFDPSLARGLDYYTGPVFEAWLPGAPEFGSVMGGGRYDGLVKRFSNLAIPATGASIGVDRFLAAVSALGLADAPSTTVKVLVVTMAGMPVAPLLAVAAELRRAGIPTQLFFPPDVEGPGVANKSGMKQQLSYANAAGIPVAIIVGENELKAGQVAIKDLQAGKELRAGIDDRAGYKQAGKSGQVTVERSEMVRVVREMLGASSGGQRAQRSSFGSEGGESMNVYDAPFGKVITENDPEKMNMKEIGGVKLYRPRIQAEIGVRTEAETAFRTKHAVGSYTDKAIINPILQSQFAFFDAELRKIIPNLGSRHLMEFVLHQYDLSCDLDGKTKAGKLSKDELKDWRDLGPRYRRTLKYLAECITMLAPPEAPSAPNEEILDLMDRAFICCEQLVAYSSLSDQTFMLFPNNTTLKIPEPGAFDYIHLSVSPEVGADFAERVQRDLRIRNKYVPVDFPLFDGAMRAASLDAGFTAVFGLNYSQCFGVLATVIDAVVVPQSGFPIPFVQIDQIIQRHSAALSVSPATIERLLSGFTVAAQNLINERRAIWKPKQEHRAYRRGFFEMPHATGKHLTWSQGMAKECLVMLTRDLAFQHLPPEWDEQPLRDAVAELSNRCGVAFECVGQDLMKARGFPIAASFKTGIGVGVSRVEIPADVGEMDCLAYSPTLRLLVLLEKKLVQAGTEATRLRDDLSQFNGPKGFFAKYAKKLKWVRDNLPAVKVGLASLPGAPQVVDPTHVAGAIVTLYPAFASYYTTDVPCISIGEFFSGWDSNGSWPLANGVFPA